MNCLDDCHRYELDNFDPQPGEGPKTLLVFYRMALDGTKTNGVTNEEVIKVLIHRLKFLNDEWMGGKFNCLENAHAIYYLENALIQLEERTKNRIARGVEATHEA